jgi:hypothetical protein
MSQRSDYLPVLWRMALIGRNFLVERTRHRKSVARCRCGQLYGGGEKLKVLLALLPSALHLDFFAAAKPLLLDDMMELRSE